MRMQFNWVALVLLNMFSPLYAEASTQASDHFSWQQVTPDFGILTDPHAATVLSWTKADCRAHIREVICVDGDGKVGCAANGAELYAPPFERLYDRLPPTLARMFCSFEQLNVISNFPGTAAAGLIKDAAGKTTGSLFVIRKSLLDQPRPLAAWATWKEQLNFGGDPQDYRVKADLPTVMTQPPATAGGVDDFLLFVMAHEMGHMFDFANGLNRFGPPCSVHDDACSGSWSAFSWQTGQQVLASQDFPERRSLCFYWCDKSNGLTKGAVLPTYHGLLHSNFVSLYAATNPLDDLAETLAYMTVDGQLASPYVIESQQGEHFDMIAHLHSPQLAAKRQFLRDFLNQPQIRYPGQE